MTEKSTAAAILPTVADCIAVLANKAIRPGTVVIDLGADDGAWTQAALAAVTGIEVHCFEPNLAKYRRLLVNLASQISSGQVVPHNASVGWTAGGASWSSLQQYATAAGITRLPFVRLGSGVPISAATKECSDLIRHGHIEFILAPANADEEAILASQLVPARYELFRHPGLGDQVLCTSDRFRSTIKNEPPGAPQILDLCQEFGITPRGVIHVGAHEGSEAARYVAGAITRTIMVEANPAVYTRLQKNVAGLNGVITINCAASDKNGTIDLNVTSFDQSSSILPLARHSEIYPSVKQVSVVTVPAKTIDQIVKEIGHNPGDYNLLNLDIQGAELLALKGALNVLPNVQAIQTEVNYEELYAGCAMIEQLDAFLESQGFDRVATTTPFHSSWGDAFYVRRRPAPVPQQTPTEFLYNARTQLVGGWLNIPTASMREAWEGATGHAHRHLIQNGIYQLPLSSEEDGRVLQLLQTGLKTAPKDRRLQLLLALMLYVPANQISVSTDGVPGWLKKSLPGLGAAQIAIAA
jgi:FkbM family methyltransferase